MAAIFKTYTGAGAGAGAAVQKFIAPELELELVDECLIAPELEPVPMLFCSGSPALLETESIQVCEKDILSLFYFGTITGRCEWVKVMMI
ncbi:unnamed protein product [Clavelina lepadiformis]|uniref:Uncharacterized protein n=1 Tax=Clavelina lepadiformis TaxID=159417 RepID=A0ABP0EYY3_CLALP